MKQFTLQIVVSQGAIRLVIGLYIEEMGKQLNSYLGAKLILMQLVSLVCIVLTPMPKSIHQVEGNVRVEEECPSWF